MTEKERMMAGKLYKPDDALWREACRCRRLAKLFNDADACEQWAYRAELLAEWLGKVGRDAYIEPPFFCDYGSHITLGDNFYANTGCVMLDVCPVVIGDRVMFGPRVCVYTATHPLDAAVRGVDRLEYGKPVTIGDDVWVGGNAVVNPGVTIGDGAVIGAGAVVTRDVPPFVIAAGNPCRVIRAITDEDKTYWQARRDEYINETNGGANV